MKKAAIFVDPFYQKNRLFDLSDQIANRDNCNYCFFALKEHLLKAGYDLATSDLHSPSQADLVLYVDMPKHPIPEDHRHKSFLMIFETDLIKPQNWNLSRHNEFKKIFTWNDEFVARDSKYIKFNFSHLMPNQFPAVSFRQKRFCTLIAGKKSVTHPLELYSERLKAIKWFTENHPDLFEFYGMGWSEWDFGASVLNRVAKKLMISRLIPCPPAKTYRGILQKKKAVLQNYRFCICYENARDISGYITEKIFDCFFAGVVPIYWGAPNVTQHLPRESFIDRREFSDHQQLFEFLENVDESAYQRYLSSAQDFIRGSSSRPFTAEVFAETIVRHVTS